MSEVDFTYKNQKWYYYKWSNEPTAFEVHSMTSNLIFNRLLWFLW